MKEKPHFKFETCVKAPKHSLEKNFDPQISANEEYSAQH